MRKLLVFPAIALLFACNNNKKQEEQTTTGTTTDQTTTTNQQPAANSAVGAGTMQVTIDGKSMTLNASALISKDKDNLQAGAPLFAMITASGGPDQENVVLNFVFDTKPGTYPVVGVGLSRGASDNGQVFGGLLGGEPKITQWKVNLTEVKDMGDNGLGGHKWSISGTFDNMTVAAMPLMLMDDTKKHPKEASIASGSFANLTFDDNWEEMMEKAMEKMKDDN